MTWVVRAIRSSEGSPAYVPSPSPQAQCTIEMKFGSQKAGAGQATGRRRRRPRQPRAPHQKPHSGPATSWKTALCPRQPRAPHGKAQFGWSEARRMRLSMRTRAQNALFRRMRFSSPAQTSSHLTEKRILQPEPHGKPHSGPATSRKTALCPRHLTEKRTLAQTAQGAPPKTAVWLVRGSQNAPFREDPCPECAFP